MYIESIIQSDQNIKCYELQYVDIKKFFKIVY